MIWDYQQTCHTKQAHVPWITRNNFLFLHFEVDVLKLTVHFRNEKKVWVCQVSIEFEVFRWMFRRNLSISSGFWWHIWILSSQKCNMRSTWNVDQQFCLFVLASHGPILNQSISRQYYEKPTEHKNATIQFQILREVTISKWSHHFGHFCVGDFVSSLLVQLEVKVCWKECKGKSVRHNCMTSFISYTSRVST